MNAEAGVSLSGSTWAVAERAGANMPAQESAALAAPGSPLGTDKAAAGGQPGLATVNDTLLEASAATVIRWAKAEASGRPLVMTSSFGAQSAVLLHLVASHAPGTPVVFLDTGYLFPETYRFADMLKAQLELDVRVYTPKLSAAYQEAAYGKLWEQGEEGVATYLQLNKVEPMQRALQELQPHVWFAGLRRNQSEHRDGLRTVEIQEGVLKVHPILTWSDADVAAYLKRHLLPVHPLVAKGYRSIGDTHSTLPTLPDQHPREGRILGKQQECGIHLSNDANQSLTASRL